ncbi:hypothetical protein OG230_06500 [Streptomyces sp. NBC_00234]|uniref:hypothetical protein n=1 Tax=Streptomyces sp. NBC_00234 TaxID=2903638 RepID=UPI002E2E6F16|nr:hypothetical protein [Streptomyces sp. NBC_00234]
MMLTRAVIMRRGHPRFRTSLRWWIAERTVLGLVGLVIGGLVLLSVLIAVALTLTLDSPRGHAERLGDTGQLAGLTMQSLRACVGTDSITPQEGNTAHELLSTTASVVGAVVPATMVGVVFIKMFSMRPFVWRRKLSVCYAHQADAHEFAEAHRGSEERIIAVRFYNRMENLTVIDLTARVYLWYLRKSPHDGTPVFRKQTLRVLDHQGIPAEDRTWFVMDRGAAFTVWVPVEAAVPTLPITEIQGTTLDGAESVRILVRLTGKAGGLGTEVFGERWFDLDGEDFELGRFAPLTPQVDADIRQWEGWRTFDHLLTSEEDGQTLPEPVKDGGPAVRGFGRRRRAPGWTTAVGPVRGGK